MIAASIYNLQSGRILRHIFVLNAAELLMNVDADEGWVPGFHDIETMRVEDGVALPRDPAELEVEQLEAAWAELRDERDRRLIASDWTQVEDVQVDQAAWAAYREALRVLPENTSDPSNPIWPTAPISGEDVPSVRVRAIRAVNRKIGAIRSQFITVIPGQEMIYLAKEMEARAYLADPSPASRATAAKYRFMHSESGITAADPEAVANTVIALADQWRGLAADLESLRLSTIQALNAATTEAEIEAVEAGFAAQVAMFLSQ